MSKHTSIREQLEADAWRNHPRFAHRLARQGRRPRRRTLAWQDRALLILASVLVLLLIVRVETARADQEFWGIEFQDGSEQLRSVAVDTEIEAVINGLNARIDVTQQFSNTGRAWAEATYRFPLPTGAAVDRMTVQVGQRVLEGEIQERQAAQRRYQQARDDGRVASLVEQEASNQFQTSLANIGPGDTVRVSISFLAPVDFREGRYSLRVPMTFTPRWDSPTTTRTAPEPLLRPHGEPDGHHLSISIDLRPGISLASVESRYHDVDIHPSLQGYRIFLNNPDTRSDRVFELNWTAEFGSAPAASLQSWDDGDAVYAQLMVAPPLAEAIAPQPREVVFIIDTSGSMEGTSLIQARAALLQGLQFLGSDDYFNLVRFSSDSEALFDESVPTHDVYLDQATRFIDSLSASGGTVMAPALNLAMGLPGQPGLLRQIVFVTDGSVGNERELLLRIAEKLGDSRLFTVSIGSAPNEWFMRKAAEFGRGSHSQIGSLTDVGERMELLWQRIENPAIQNVCVDWGMDAEFYPEIIPDLYAGEPLWLYARLPASPGTVTLCGELEGRDWQLEIAQLPGQGSSELATLWARSKVEALEDSRIFGLDDGVLRQQVLDLALDYGLLSPYTALVAVDRTPRRPADQGLAAEAVPSLLPAGSGPGAGFSQTATGWRAQLLLSLISLLVATGMLLYAPPSRKSVPGGARSPMAPSST